MEEEKFVELEEDFIVLAIPSTTMEVSITAKVWNDGEVIDVTRTLPFAEVRAAFNEAHAGYTPSTSVFVLNPDVNKSKLERLLSAYLKDVEEEDAD